MDMDITKPDKGRWHTNRCAKSTNKVYKRDKHTHIIHPYLSNQSERTFVEQKSTKKMAPSKNSRAKATKREGEFSKSKNQIEVKSYRKGKG